MSNAALHVRCPAKVNVHLEVLRRRADGYHDIDTVMQAIDLWDDLRLEPAPDLQLACSDPALPTDERNLVFRAALALREAAGCAAGAHLRLTKRIPDRAGLGGGSSDAAGALAGLNRLWGLGLSTDALRQVAERVGSDVAFFLTGGAARCTGRGERVEPLPTPWRPCFVLVCPDVGVSTPEAYGRLSFPLTPVGPDGTILRRRMISGDVAGVGLALFNRLESPAFDMHPALREGKARLAETGLFAGVLMSGSGSALFGLCEPATWALAAERAAVLQLGTCHRVRGIPQGVVVSPA
ncbi:4-(cytidine 5'-diphospho)-2-C-methyl-D-erythritol kinase [bacterium]|nr:4-(cytidine 5'-diphospho)-2-C-methyl-D-erythritol kinase [bacterium]